MTTVARTKTADTHKRISQTYAGRVDKNVKFNICQEHVGDTLEACYTHVLYAWCTLIYTAVSRCALQAHLGSKIFKHAQKFSRSPACPGLYILNKFHACNRRVEYALNAFCACLRHISVRYMHIPIL